MWTILVLSVFVFVSVRESNATSTESLLVTAGRPVNVTVGPEDAVYCRLKNSWHETIFDGFGPCRLELDRVTQDHRGMWMQWVAVPGTVVAQKRFLSVEVAEPVNSKPVVTSNVATQLTSVMFTCSVPVQHKIQSCAFREPGGLVHIATRGVTKESYNGQIRYESYAEDHDCTIRFMRPAELHTGFWRCAVNTEQGTAYNFFQVKESDFTPDATNYYDAPVLTPGYSRGSSTEGDAMVIPCSIDAAIRYCYFTTPNGTVINIDPTTSSADYEYVGNGFDAGECGLRVNNVPLSAQGVWSCSVGLVDRSEERRAFTTIYVNERMLAYQRWQGSTMAVRLRIATGPKLEYCRFVRGNVIGFSSMNVPLPYILDSEQLLYGECGLTILIPTVEDQRPWTIVAKVIGEDGERSVTTTPEPRPSTGGLSRTSSILLWSFFGTIFIFLIGTSLMNKRNRQWTSQRVIRVRNSFRRQPQPPPNAPELPQTNQHINVATDLPGKV